MEKIKQPVKLNTRFLNTIISELRLAYHKSKNVISYNTTLENHSLELTSCDSPKWYWWSVCSLFLLNTFLFLSPLIQTPCEFWMKHFLHFLNSFFFNFTWTGLHNWILTFFRYRQDLFWDNVRAHGHAGNHQKYACLSRWSTRTKWRSQNSAYWVSTLFITLRL